MSNNTQSSNNPRLSKFRESLFDQMNKHILSDQQNKPTSAFVSGKSLQDMSIGIIGGGMTGLYAGMLLDSLGVNYTIFEASDPGQGGRDGGRVYTHYFDPDPEKHQYAELGPMRFPDNPTQSRLFNFWHYLNSTAANTNNATQIPQIPYILFDDGEDNDSGNLLCYNNMPPVTRTQAKADNSLLGFDPLFEDDKYMPFKSNGKLLPASTLLDNAIEPFLLMFEGEGIEAAWQALLQYDGYSARFYLETVGANGVPYPPEIVDYIETVTSYTGVFDMALLEIVLDNFTFGTPSEPDNNQWFTFDGGTSRLTVEMLNRISPQNYQTGCMVNALQQNSDGTATVCYSREGLPCMSADFDYVSRRP